MPRGTGQIIGGHGKVNPMRGAGQKNRLQERAGSHSAADASCCMLTLVPVAADFGREHPPPIPRRTFATCGIAEKPHPCERPSPRAKKEWDGSSMGRPIIVFAPHGSCARPRKIREGDVSEGAGADGVRALDALDCRRCRVSVAAMDAHRHAHADPLLTCSRMRRATVGDIRGDFDAAGHRGPRA